MHSITMRAVLAWPLRHSCCWQQGLTQHALESDSRCTYKCSRVDSAPPEVHASNFRAWHAGPPSRRPAASWCIVMLAPPSPSSCAAAGLGFLMAAGAGVQQPDVCPCACTCNPQGVRVEPASPRPDKGRAGVQHHQ